MQAQNLIKSWVQNGGRKFGWLAAQVPVGANTMSSWMRGKHMPNAACRARLSDITGVDVRDANMWEKS
jgi:hypothetical protein